MEWPSRQPRTKLTWARTSSGLPYNEGMRTWALLAGALGLAALLIAVRMLPPDRTGTPSQTRLLGYWESSPQYPWVYYFGPDGTGDEVYRLDIYVGGESAGFLWWANDERLFIEMI